METTRSHGARWALTAGVLPLAGVLVAGCAPGPATGSGTTGRASPSSTRTVTSGVHILDTQNSFSLTVPSGWVAVQDPERATPLVITGAPSASPDPSVSTAAQAGFDAGAKAVAVDPVASTFASNATVVIQPVHGASAGDVTQLADSATKALVSLGAEDVATSATTVDRQPAESVSYHLTPSGSTTQVTGRQVYLIEGDSAYVLTVTLAPDTDPGVADTIISTLEVGKSAG